MKKTIIPLLLASCFLTLSALARPANYDEDKIEPYTLPDPLLMANSTTRVTTPAEWQQRRQEIIALFQDQMYGTIPPPPEHLIFEEFADTTIMAGSIQRKQIRMYFTPDKTGPYITWILYLPLNTPRPLPAFIGLNYYGNHEIENDPTIPITTGWLRNNKRHHIENNRASEKSRGLSARPGANQSWPFKLLAQRGYAMITACYADVSPDTPDLYTTQGVHTIFPQQPENTGNNTTALAAWAWALMRGMDMIEKETAIDPTKVAVVGCSRLGKAALLAGACDERFAVTIPNQTGGGGTPLAKRNYGENVALQNQNFPHWFCRNFRQYSDNEAAMPFDQHMLLAACAPRHLYVSSFPGKWFDPYGEFLSMKAAEPVWHTLNLPGLPASEWPDEMHPTYSTHMGYHRRPYDHGIAEYDWQCYIAFTDQIFNRTINWHSDKQDQWHGFKRHHFEVANTECWVTEPTNPLPGNHWVWCTEWPDSFVERTGTVELLREGYYFVHLKVGTMSLGNPTALKKMDDFYHHLTKQGLNRKCILTGVSRGGLYAYRFANANPERIIAIYGDAPVCDFKSWPMGVTQGLRVEDGIRQLLSGYGFKDEAEAIAYKGNPIDILEPLAKANIPLIHVIGEADDAVPPATNSDIVEERYKALGGTITVFRKPGLGHHPHGLDNPRQVVDLLRDYTRIWDIATCK